MNIHDYINFEYQKGNEKEATWLKNYIEKESDGTPILFDDFPIFRGYPSGVALDDKIYLNKNGFFSNQDLGFKFYVIFHEIDHHKRKNNNIFVLFKKYILEDNFEAFLKLNEVEEEFAEEYADNTSKLCAKELNNSKMYYTHNSGDSTKMARMFFNTFKKYAPEYDYDFDTILMDFMKMKIQPVMNEGQNIEEIFFRNTEVAPAPVKPKVNPGIAVPKKNPLQIPLKRPDGLPVPPPKAYKKNYSNSLEKYFNTLNEKHKFARLIKENPMNFDNHPHRPFEKAKKGIEGKGPSPFSNIDFLHKKNADQSALDRMSTEEFDEVVKNALNTGIAKSPMDVMKTIDIIKDLEKIHKTKLEDLALNSVVKNFGLPEEIKQRLDVSLSDNVDMDVDDEEQPLKKAEKLLNDDQKKIAEKLVQKRVVQNALMMGSGYRAHRLFQDIKPAIDNIDPRLFPLYDKVINNMEFYLWTIEVPKQGRIPLGKSEINPETMQGEVRAKLFLILLHETAKSAVELLFLQSVFNIAEEHGNEVYDYVLKKSDSYDEEQWMKLIGPKLWKYLHDVINYIVMDRNNDYTIVSFLLNKISLLPPDQFLKLIDEVVNDGPKAIQKLTFMLDEVEKDIEEFEKQNNEAPAPEDIMDEPNFQAMNDLVKQANNIIDKAVPADNAILNHKPFAKMNGQELQNYINLAIEESEYEKAAEARDELNGRK